MKLVTIDSVNPSTYNPRVADPRRLEVIWLSLQKLGFVLPTYADKNGEILSGHQRHLVSKMNGVTFVPVDYLQCDLTLEDRKAINIAFNRGTNDLAQADTPASITDALTKKNVWQLAARIPDKRPDTEEFYPCMNAEKISVAELVKANTGRWVNYARNMASMLAQKNIEMPLVATRDLKVVNGIGRLQYLAERRKETANVVFISDDQAAFADAVLNYLSMDFDIHNRYRDLLRFNSFRRARRQRNELGKGFIFALRGNIAANEFDITNPESAREWIAYHGRSVLDFGAGHLTETELLRSVGVLVTPFEPYRITGSDEINKAESLRVCREFLSDVAAGIRYTSIFISSVLNSVPFAEDRDKIVCLCAALCSKNTRLYAVASSVSQTGWDTVLGRGHLSEKQSRLRTFSLEYEHGITLGDFSSKPKVQKYHTQEEFYTLFKKYFGVVGCKDAGKNAQAICTQALPVNREALLCAIEFEFDLPYPDGSKMGLVQEAITAFKQRGVL
jgi:hypothetical protein